MLLSLENELQQELMLSEQTKRLLSFDLTDFWNWLHTFNEVFNRKNITKIQNKWQNALLFFLKNNNKTCSSWLYITNKTVIPNCSIHANRPSESTRARVNQTTVFYKEVLGLCRWLYINCISFSTAWRCWHDILHRQLLPSFSKALPAAVKYLIYYRKISFPALRLCTSVIKDYPNTFKQSQLEVHSSCFRQGLFSKTLTNFNIKAIARWSPSKEIHWYQTLLMILMMWICKSQNVYFIEK